MATNSTHAIVVFGSSTPRTRAFVIEADTVRARAFGLDSDTYYTSWGIEVLPLSGIAPCGKPDFDVFIGIKKVLVPELTPERIEELFAATRP